MLGMGLLLVVADPLQDAKVLDRLDVARNDVNDFPDLRVRTMAERSVGWHSLSVHAVWAHARMHAHGAGRHIPQRGWRRPSWGAGASRGRPRLGTPEWRLTGKQSRRCGPARAPAWMDSR